MQRASFLQVYNFQGQCPLQEFSRRVCQHVEAFEHEKRNTTCSPRRPKLWLALLTFFEYSQLPLMFYVFIEEVAIVVPLFSFFSSKFFLCTIPRFAHSLFNVGLLLSSLGFSEGAPPPLRSCFCLFIRISSRVESSSSSSVEIF